MLHDCIANGHVLDHDGLVVQSGLVTLGDQQYYVNPTTHLIEKNTEVNINSTLYLADAEGRLQQKPLPAEPGMESAADSSRADKGFRDPQGSSDPDSDPDPDADYVPTNEEDTALQEELPAGGSIRYSDNYPLARRRMAGDARQCGKADRGPHLWERCCDPGQRDNPEGRFRIQLRRHFRLRSGRKRASGRPCGTLWEAVLCDRAGSECRDAGAADVMKHENSQVKA